MNGSQSTIEQSRTKTSITCKGIKDYFDSPKIRRDSSRTLSTFEISKFSFEHLARLR